MVVVVETLTVVTASITIGDETGNQLIGAPEVIRARCAQYRGDATDLPPEKSRDDRPRSKYRGRTSDETRRHGAYCIGLDMTQ